MHNKTINMLSIFNKMRSYINYQVSQEQFQKLSTTNGNLWIWNYQKEGKKMHIYQLCIVRISQTQFESWEHINLRGFRKYKNWKHVNLQYEKIFHD